MNQTDGKCYRSSPPIVAWTWISGASAANSFGFSPTSFGSAMDGVVSGSTLQPIGYFFGGWTNIAGSTSLSRRLYSSSVDFSSITSLSECSTNNPGTLEVESANACPSPRMRNAIWLVQDSYVFIYGGHNTELLLYGLHGC
jgi:hypothetical protein